MRRFWLAVALLTGISPAAALDQASMPSKFPIPWGASAGSAYVRSIPTPSQIGIQNCAASLTDGFPPLTFVSSSAGGCPPFGQDFNGILKQITQWSQWQQAGGPIFYDSAFAAAIGGYPKGTLLTSRSFTAGHRWLSLVDNNTVNPDQDTTGWVQDPSQIGVGTPMQSLSATVPYGYVAANGLTIGTAASNATGLADGVAGNSQAYLLYVFVWNNYPTAPLFNSSGGAASRGANANADFVNNKALTLPSMKGSGLIGADTMGGSPSTFLSGVPVVSGSTTAPGSIVGENTHVLSAAETPSITSSNGAQNIAISGTTNVSGTIDVTGSVSGTVSVTGSTSGTVSVTGSTSGNVSVTGSTSGTVSVTGSTSGTVSVAGDVAAGGRFIPTSSGAVTSLQAAGTATVNIAPANASGNWAGVTTLSGSMSGANTLSGSMSGSNTLSGSMSGSNTLSGGMSGANTLSGGMSGPNTLSGSMSGANSMSGSNTMSGANSISVTSDNTGGGEHNNVERSTVVRWNLKL